jgi:3-(3-hydroxy-phenyl)propionate hydroxylase
VNATDDVLIVGAGPVGLTAAFALGQGGRRVRVIDKLDRPSTQWRASTFHAPTLEMCAELGIVDRMLELGLKAPVYQIRDRSRGVIAEFDMGVLSEDTKYPFRLQLEQYKYVGLLLDALRQHPNVTVSYGSEVTDVAAGDGESTVTLTVDGARLQAGLLLGADGASSTVRKSLGIPFEGETYEHRYLLLSVDGDVEQVLPGIALVNYVTDPREHLMVLRIPDLWRVMFEVPADVPDDVALSDSYVHATLDRLDPRLSAMPVPSRQIYKVHQRVARHFKRGRALLLGDAAHVNSPIGGMGLNSGIHDAIDLANVLASAGTDADLATWAERRRRLAVEEIPRITHESTRRLTAVHAAQAARDHDLLAEIAGDPVRSREFLLEASMIANARRHAVRS